MNEPIAHAANDELTVTLAPHIVGDFLGVSITSTILTAWLTILILVVLVTLSTRKLKLIPSKMQSVVELLVGGLYSYVEETLENKQATKRYFPIIATIFIFVLAMNWVGLLPGVTSIGYFAEGSSGNSELIPFFYPAASDLNITIAIALIAVFTVEVAGVLTLGFWRYGGKFINFSSPLAFIIGLIELVSEIARLVSFSFRLFGNIFAGKVLLLVIMLFVPYILPVPIMAYEMFVGVIQAAIFAVLTLFFIKLAIAEPDH